MNLSGALIKRVLETADFDTWIKVRKHYLPAEYHQLYEAVAKHSNKFHKLPTVEELKYAIRDSATLDKVYALESIVTDAEPPLLLDYLKDEVALGFTYNELHRLVDKSLPFQSASEIRASLQELPLKLEQVVEIDDESEISFKVNPLYSDYDIENRITLGLNDEFDAVSQIASTDYILIGGRRGSGKSLTCNNIAKNVRDKGKSSLMFSVEMPIIEVHQRDLAISTEIPLSTIRKRSFSEIEWERFAKEWSTRYENGEEHFQAYLEHKEFDKFHASISREYPTKPFLEVIHDPRLTLSRIRSEVDKRVAMGEDLGIIIVDYINQVRRGDNPTNGIYDWKDQIEVSKGLKEIATIHGIPVVSPYQTDKEGEARFAKGILDSADCAMTLEAPAGENCIVFNITKMRNADDEMTFASETLWQIGKIGPRSVEIPVKEEDKKKAKDLIGKGSQKRVPDGVYETTEGPPF